MADEKTSNSEALLEDFHESWRRRKFADCWSITSLLGEQGVGPRYRIWKQATLYHPSRAEWSEALPKSGPQGGLSARLFEAFEQAKQAIRPTYHDVAENVSEVVNIPTNENGFSLTTLCSSKTGRNLNNGTSRLL